MQLELSPSARRVATLSQTLKFGDLLRHWRNSRRLSQLALAEVAGVSGRHLSFLESGRASPSREMVGIVCSALDIPLQDRNKLLLAAGFAPAYRERDMAVPELEPARRALEFILAQQEPFPALVMDSQWNVKMTNAATRSVFGYFYGSGNEAKYASANAVRSTFHPAGLRYCIANWEEFAGNLVQRLHAEAVSSGSDDSGLLDEVLSYPDIPANWRLHDPFAAVDPLLTMKLRKGDTAIAFFSTLTSFSSPFDVTLAQLKIECFFPADLVTEEFARNLSKNRATPS